jgi:hypothetical protein
MPCDELITRPRVLPSVKMAMRLREEARAHGGCRAENILNIQIQTMNLSLSFNYMSEHFILQL